MATKSVWKQGANVSGLLVVAAFGLALLPVCLSAQEIGVRRALLIGVGDYEIDHGARAANFMAPADLDGPANDVAILARLLTNRFAFQPENVVTLVDDQADRSEILAALNAIVATAGPEDVVYIHFSGLGSRVADTSGDETDGWDDTILPHDARMPGIADITDDELQAILGRLRAASALVVVDAGHDPMPVAAGSEVRVRAAGRDGRTDLYAATALAGQGTDTESRQGGRYVLMSAAAPGQFALESRIDDGPSFGWFSWSLARALDVVDQKLSVSEAYGRTRQAMDNLGIGAGLRPPAPVLIGDADLLGRSVLGGSGVFSGAEGGSTRNWVSAIPRGEARVSLEQGMLFGGAKGSLWAIFPPDTSDFRSAETLATAEVVEVHGADAVARVDGGGSVPEGSRAVRLSPAPPAAEVAVWLRTALPGGATSLQEEIRSAARNPVRFVDSARGARFIVSLDERGYRVFGPGGLQELARFDSGDDQAIKSLAILFDRSVRIAHLQALDNPSGSVGIRFSVNPIDVDGTPRLTRVSGAMPIPTFRVRQPGEPRAPDNSLLMSISVDRRAYITVVDIGPEGGISPLFPNPVSDEKLFFPEGLVPEGTEIRIPDSLVGGTAGFYIDYEPPGGQDTLRVFATTDPVTAQRLRDYLGRYVAAIDSAGTLPPFTDVFLPLEAGPPLEVGTPETGFGAPTGIGQALPVNFVDWAATSVSFRVQD